MIGVLADDLTGAAEIAAVGVHHGLTAEVQMGQPSPAHVGLIAVSTGSRMMDPPAAATVNEEAAVRLRDMGAEWVFKKVDSVLRGPVLAELIAVQRAWRYSRVLMVPANPSLQRTIRNGQYFVAGVPLHQTDFTHDPHHPAQTSWIEQLLGDVDGTTARSVNPQETLPQAGIFVGNTETTDDLSAWTAQLNPYTLPAGASDFFAHTLHARGYSKISSGSALTALPATPILFVCGCSPPHAEHTIAQATQHGIPISPIPTELLTAETIPSTIFDSCVAEIAELLRSRGRTVVTINNLPPAGFTPAQSLTKRLATIVARITRECPLERLQVEGGETASAVISELGWRRLVVFGDLTRGIVVMRAASQNGPWLIIKPGSYRWPEQAW